MTVIDNLEPKGNLPWEAALQRADFLQLWCQVWGYSFYQNCPGLSLGLIPLKLMPCQWGRPQREWNPCGWLNTLPTSPLNHCFMGNVEPIKDGDISKSMCHFGVKDSGICVPALICFKCQFKSLVYWTTWIKVSSFYSQIFRFIYKISVLDFSSTIGFFVYKSCELFHIWSTCCYLTDSWARDFSNVCSLSKTNFSCIYIILFFTWYFGFVCCLVSHWIGQ